MSLQDEASRELRKVAKELDTVDNKSRDWGNTLLWVKRGILAVGTAVTGALGFGVKIAADLETAEIGLGTLLNSTEEARKTVERLKIEAARTPFELPGLTKATQLLTSVTKDGDKSIDILLDVGEGLAAMGKGQAELDRIIVNLQQIAATGRAMTIDIRQFAFAGIPIYEMLAEVTGKTGEALGDFINEGGVTFELLTQMFDEANDEGGRFFNAFVNQSGSFNQALSNMKDSFAIFLSDIAKGTGLFDGLTQAMLTVSNVMGNYQQVIANGKQRLQEYVDLIDQKTGLVTHLRIAWASITEVFNSQLKPALDELWVALQPLMPYIKAFGVVLGAAFVGALHLVIGAFTLAAQVITAVLTGLTNLTTFIVNTVVAVLHTLDSAVQVIVSVFKKDWVGAISAVQDGIESLVGWVKDLIKQFKKAISLAGDLGGNVKGYASKLLKKVLPGRADGGAVTANTPYMVGERGAELFVPSVSGTIVPNSQLGYGQGVTINVYGDVTGEEVVNKVKEAMANDIKEMVRV